MYCCENCRNEIDKSFYKYDCSISSWDICWLVNYICHEVELEENKGYEMIHAGHPKYDDALISSLIIMGYLENIFTSNKLVLSLDKIKPLNYL
jgi:hypothetical protein